MTLRDLLLGMTRRWMLTLGLVLLSTPLFAAVATTPSSFTGRVAVYFLQPASSREPNVLGNTRTSVISTASAVQRAVQGHPTTQVISDDVSLTDIGIQEGTLVRLPNSGGQWANNFETPALFVEAVDHDVEAVQARLTSATQEINTTLARMQRASGAAATTWVTTKTEPEVATVVEVSGSRKRALFYLSLLVIGAVVASVVFLETRDAQRPRPRFYTFSLRTPEQNV